MIRYTLSCACSYRFDSWFQSANAFDTLLAGGHLTCPACNGSAVVKALMTPGVRPGRDSLLEPPQPDPGSRPDGPQTTGIDDEQARPDRQIPAAAMPAPAGVDQKIAAIAALRAEIESKADYVGATFASRARAMHEGGEPSRPIYGEAGPDEARKLIDEGVPVAPLPFIPRRKTN